jgi:hypothetical protein
MVIEESRKLAEALRSGSAIEKAKAFTALHMAGAKQAVAMGSVRNNSISNEAYSALVAENRAKAQAEAQQSPPAPAPQPQFYGAGDGIFSNPFFSAAGQAERLRNAGATLSTVLNPFSTQTIRTPSGAPAPLVNSPISRGIIVGGVVAGGIAGGAALLGGVKGSLLGASAATGGLGLARLSVPTAALIGAGGGLLAGSLLGGGGGAARTGDQITNTSQNTDASQNTNTYTYSDSSSQTYILNSPNASADTQTGAPVVTTTPTQTVSPAQSVVPTQSAEGGGTGISPLILLGAAAIIAFASSRS